MIYICVPTTQERANRLEVLKQSLRENAGYPYILVTYENFREGYIKPIHKILKGLNPNTMVWCIGDDTKLIEPDTLKRLVDKFNESFPDKDGVVNPNDGIQFGEIITMPLCTAQTMIDGTYEGYFLNYADNEFTDIMNSKGKYIYCPDVVVEHQHWVNGKAPRDDTYSFALTKLKEDQQLYESRKNKIK